MANLCLVQELQMILMSSFLLQLQKLVHLFHLVLLASLALLYCWSSMLLAFWMHVLNGQCSHSVKTSHCLYPEERDSHSRKIAYYSWIDTCLQWMCNILCAGLMAVLAEKQRIAEEVASILKVRVEIDTNFTQMWVPDSTMRSFFYSLEHKNWTEAQMQMLLTMYCRQFLSCTVY